MEKPTPPALDHDDPHQCFHGRRRHGFLLGLLLGVLGAGLLGFAIGAATPAAEAAFGALARHERERGGGPDHDGPPTLAEARDHAEFFVAFALHRVQATPDQQERALKIVDGAVEQAFPTVEKHRTNRAALRAIVGAKTIDHDAIEKLRVDEVALADSLSRVVSKAIADAAEVLTADQRLEFLDHLDQFHHRP